jgi:hypothetical protein
MAVSPKIYCSYTKLADPKRLKPNPANPNKHSDAQIELLAKLITAHGWRHPITLSKRSKLVVSGHCRLSAALLLGLKQVPVDEQSFKNQAEELAVLIADNQIPELSETDGLMMADILCELDQANYPLELTALSKEEIEAYINGPTGTGGGESQLNEPLKCPQCGYVFES